ncbi:uncharacterized protein ATNIH1004_006612 [Aspergillus tanneri]|uniref:Uncharacterized protein n=1 Tax=Aspergillus tanneri TaxID=1220188 RepID=A0A5M9MRI7_9EURO|nr:uncharacterized protein ATNIH1004_006612 [Aspergillus tanneri]KAA8647910.1 hypothetical protein ATNIH1004_006612 [Aspergillus tanneri]
MVPKLGKQNQKHLSAEQISHLAKLTKNWSCRTGDDIPQHLYDWILEPVSKFWGFKVFRADTELVEYCLSDIEEVENASKMNPVRRRVILLILYDIVQEEKKRLQGEAEKNKARRLGEPESGDSKSRAYLTKAIRNIRKRCSQLQRYGGRWSLFERREAILEFPITYAANSFERAKMEEIEIEALNEYEALMCNHKYRSILQKAFEALVPQHLQKAPLQRRGQKRRWHDNSTTAKTARKRSSAFSFTYSQGECAQDFHFRARNDEIDRMNISGPTNTSEAAVDSGIGSSESVSSSCRSPRSDLLANDIQLIGNNLFNHYEARGQLGSQDVPSLEPSVNSFQPPDTSPWRLPLAASQQITAFAGSTTGEPNSSQPSSLEIHCSSTNTRATTTGVDSQQSPAYASAIMNISDGRDQSNISSVRTETHGEGLHCTPYNVVVQGFEDAFYRGAGGEFSSQNVARGFENVFHHPVGDSSSEDVPQCLRDRFHQTAQGIPNHDDIARGFENSFCQTSINYQNAARGFEDAFCQWSGVEL